VILIACINQAIKVLEFYVPGHLHFYYIIVGHWIGNKVCIRISKHSVLTSSAILALEIQKNGFLSIILFYKKVLLVQWK
jgi:hypothetical protein